MPCADSALVRCRAEVRLGTHRGNVEAGEGEGLVPLLALVGSGDEWDRYETLGWALYLFARP